MAALRPCDTGRVSATLRGGTLIAIPQEETRDDPRSAFATMTNDALRAILPIAGWGHERARAVEITGDIDPILPTPFRIGETSAAALAAGGLSVPGLWGFRTGRRQEGPVATRQGP